MADNPFWAALVPELTCSDLARSLAFYCDLLGFRVRFTRSGFAYLERGQAQIMLEAEGQGWVTAPAAYPFGRGINLQIEVDDIAALDAALTAQDKLPFRAPADNWYAEGEIEHGQRELLVQDPDGYLLRFVSYLGTRPAAGG